MHRTCRYLWSLCRPFEARIQSIQLEDKEIKALLGQSRRRIQYFADESDGDGSEEDSLRQSRFRLSLWMNLKSLESLDLRSHCCDEFLECVHNQNLLPSIKHLSFVGSEKITNRGLKYLAETRHIAENLETIDITYCSNTTYGGTFPLRDNCSKLKYIRRQPKWLSGHFFTPFADTVTDCEVHTYWVDGSFQFGRDIHSKGFVCEMFKWDGEEDHVGDKLQYSNFSPPESWPSWTRFAFRPGVSLFKLDDEAVDNELVRSVLVSQHIRGLRPPRKHKVMEEAKDAVDLGTSRYYDSDGNLLPEDAPEDDRVIMVSKMRLVPFAEDEDLMPPNELVAQNRSICEQSEKIDSIVLQAQENHLHTAMGGEP